MVNRLLPYLGFMPWVVHRLDMHTSGASHVSGKVHAVSRDCYSSFLGVPGNMSQECYNLFRLCSVQVRSVFGNVTFSVLEIDAGEQEHHEHLLFDSVVCSQLCIT